MMRRFCRGGRGGGQEKTGAWEGRAVKREKPSKVEGEEEETGPFENKCLLPAPHGIIEADSLPSAPIKGL